MIEVKNLTVTYSGLKQENTALQDVSLTVPQGTVCAVIGPSGCGKSTLLKVVAGLITDFSGQVHINGGGVSPKKLRIGFMPQNYGLLPWQSVADNIRLACRIKDGWTEEKAAKMEALCQKLGIEDLLHRYPQELSGGQQQRVAIARSLVNEPKVLLLDEPLGALDLQLRKQMQISLKRLQRKLGMTYVYVTHDQEEAMTLSDRIAVINNGRIEQLGTPSEIYETPATSFSARFLGESNFFDSDNGTEISVRPEFVQLTENYTKDSVQGTVKAINFLGAFSRITVEADADGKEIFSLEPSGLKGWHSGDKVFINWEKENEQHIKKDA